MTLCETVLNTVAQDKAMRMDQFESMKKKLDEEDVEALMESIQKIDKVWTYVMDICGVMLKAMPETMSPIIQQKFLGLYAAKLLNLKKHEDYEILDSLCMVVDCLEFGTESLFNAIAG